MTSRSGRGRWERVLEARRQAREALGRDRNARELYDAPPKPKTPLRAPELPRAVLSPSPGVLVLSVGEAAERLGMSRAQLEAMIDAGKVTALKTGLTRMVPKTELERLLGVNDS